jgi:hypothetical protein
MQRRRRPPWFHVLSIHRRAADMARRRAMEDRIVSGVCPLCGGTMTPRCGRGGPYFHCRCQDGK